MKLAIILHNIRSVHNVGSIFRTADAAGVGKVFLTGVTPTPLDRFERVRTDFHKVALGAESTIPWEHIRFPVRVIKKLKAEGYRIFALEQDPRAMPYYSFPPARSSAASRPLALILGNEVHGLPPSVLEHADTILEIPMRGTKESLNVSVAFGVVVYALTFGYNRSIKKKRD